MPGTNLTREEATERARIIQVHDYDITLDLTRGEETFLSVTTVRFSAEDGAASFIDIVADHIHTIWLNGRELKHAQVFRDSRIELTDLMKENELRVTADFRYTNTGEGLHRFVDPVDSEVYLYSQFEVPDSRRVFTVFEQPDLKAEFRFTVYTPAHWTVISNSPTPLPSSENDSAVWRFEKTPRISSYITAIIAGPYQCWRSELTSADKRIIPLQVFSRKSLAEHVDAEDIFEITRRGFAYFEDQFQIPFPFSKYDQIFTPEFNAGAMENAGAVTITELYIFRSKVSDALRERRAVTVLHELAHMWFGDLVTMAWWNDLWLNESFASWASTIAAAETTEWTDAWTTFSATEKSWAYRQDQLPSTHSIVATINDLDDVQVNFDGITYAKGASVVKQLAAWVGVDTFFAGVSRYLDRHAWSNTELTDLLIELEKASGRDLSEWATLWLQTAGVNTLATELSVDHDGVIQSFVVRQTAPADHPTLRPHRIAIGCYSFKDGRLVRDKRIETDIAGAETVITELQGAPQSDLILLNDDDLGYAKIRLDPLSLQTAQQHLATMENSLSRQVLWGYLWDLTRDAELASREFIRIGLNAIATETESTTLRVVLSWLTTAATRYTTPADRQEIVQQVADGFWGLTQRAVPGSDAQFQFLKAFTQLAEYSSHGDEVTALLRGSLTLDGLAVDTDLGWELLTALVASGTASEAEITAMLATDATATGEQAAAHARAAIPTAQSKYAAWVSIVERDTEPGAIIRSTAAGFTRSVDIALLKPFVTRYFDMLLPVWRERSYQTAEKLILGLYPAPLADEALVSETRRWLDTQEAPAALQRLVRENLAGVERAVRAQACDERSRKTEVTVQ